MNTGTGMYDCYTCGEPVSMPYECNYCGEYNCSDHRLPEAHDCDGVEFLAGDERWFKDKSSGKVVTAKSEIITPEPIEPKYTVGTRPEPDYEASPDVKLKSKEETDKRARKVEYQKWVRPTIVVISVVLLGLINPMAAAGASGSLVVLVIIWFVIKGYRPTWTAGWSGTWLFILGLVTAIVNGVVGMQSTLNPITVGLAVATILVLPAFVIWKLYDVVSAGRTRTE